MLNLTGNYFLNWLYNEAPKFDKAEIIYRMNQPLVSIICLSYNHSEFVGEAVSSVLNQDYSNIELIVVDDASTDNSRQVIRDILKNSEVQFIALDKNVGNCKAFNEGFRNSSGVYVIDLAADDVLLPNRVSEGVRAFIENDIGINFCDAIHIDKNGKESGSHYRRDDERKLTEKVPEGDLYVDLIQSYFISPPTMMIRREVLESLGGYDETLMYEDFDFWIRSSRKYRYGFTDQMLVKKRILEHSHSKNQFRFRSGYQKSTLAVCEKIKALNQTHEEHLALKKRCRYEIRLCIRQGNLSLIPSFLRLMKS